MTRRRLHCRGCGATFEQAPRPYEGICPHCLARGDIITLTTQAGEGADSPL